MVQFPGMRELFLQRTKLLELDERFSDKGMLESFLQISYLLCCGTVSPQIFSLENNRNYKHIIQVKYLCIIQLYVYK